MSPLVVAGCSTSDLQSEPSGDPVNVTAESPQSYLAGDLPPAPNTQYDSGSLIPRQFAANAGGSSGSASSDRRLQVAYAGDTMGLYQNTKRSPSLERARPTEEAPFLDQARFMTLAQNADDLAGDTANQSSQ